jgi:hypothetical protein
MAWDSRAKARCPCGSVAPWSVDDGKRRASGARQATGIQISAGGARALAGRQAWAVTGAVQKRSGASVLRSLRRTRAGGTSGGPARSVALRWQAGQWPLASKSSAASMGLGFCADGDAEGARQTSCQALKSPRAWAIAALMPGASMPSTSTATHHQAWRRVRVRCQKDMQALYGCAVACERLRFSLHGNAAQQKQDEALLLRPG